MSVAGWITVGLFAWIAHGASSLFLMWRTWNSLAAYLADMQEVSQADRLAFGWPEDDPQQSEFGARNTWVRRRFMLRLFLWGAPAQLEHTKVAHRAARVFRRSYAGLIGVSLVPVVLVVWLGLDQVIWLLGVVLVATVMIYRPWKW
jgi:hypothetical protein